MKWSQNTQNQRSKLFKKIKKKSNHLNKAWHSPLTSLFMYYRFSIISWKNNSIKIPYKVENHKPKLPYLKTLIEKKCQFLKNDHLFYKLEIHFLTLSRKGVSEYTLETPQIRISLNNVEPLYKRFLYLKGLFHVWQMNHIQLNAYSFSLMVDLVFKFICIFELWLWALICF